MNNIERAAEVISDHRHEQFCGDCACGWSWQGIGGGVDYAEHLAHALADAGLLITDEALDWYSSPGIELVAAERRRQVMEEQWTPAHDDEHTEGELAAAGAAYALDVSHGPRTGLAFWPFESDGYKPGTNSVRTLTKAAALIVAELDRVIRREAQRDV